MTKLPEAFASIIRIDRVLRRRLREKVVSIHLAQLCRERAEQRRNAQIYLQAQGRSAA